VTAVLMNSITSSEGTTQHMQHIALSNPVLQTISP
jgi:hypothetical protein